MWINCQTGDGVEVSRHRVDHLTCINHHGDTITLNLVILKALCHDIRLDCFVIASLVEKFN